MTLIGNPESIELDDVQGLVVRGYSKLPLSHFFFVKIGDAEYVRNLLHDIIPMITPATGYRPEVSLNVAFSHSGLKALGLSEKNIKNFPIPFKVGMTDPVRQRMLGDWGDSAPENWVWGGRDKDEIHMVFLLYACDKKGIEKFRGDMLHHITRFKRDNANKYEKGNFPVEIIYEIGGYRRDDSKEHFGFHDSISQPVIRGCGRKGPDQDIVAAGEFVLGYLNEYNLYPFSPLIAEEQGNLNLLPPDAGGSGQKDLGRNGTFIAFRQIQQHVDEFWEFMKSKTADPDGGEDKKEQVKLASKMIGRWPGGAPIVKYPDKDPEIEDSDNDFGYAKNDPYGYNCPLGSHLRRNNPRDSFRDQGSKQSFKVTRRHRIIRRGRLYDLQDHGKTEKGLLFIGLNADLQQQFEFIYHVWSNSLQPNKKSLYSDPDPIIGVPDPLDPQYLQKRPEFRFAIQQENVTKYVSGLQRFVRTRGGGYFFLPGISAIRYLTTLGEM